MSVCFFQLKCENLLLLSEFIGDLKNHYTLNMFFVCLFVLIILFWVKLCWGYGVVWMLGGKK